MADLWPRGIPVGALLRTAIRSALPKPDGQTRKVAKKLQFWRKDKKRPRRRGLTESEADLMRLYRDIDSDKRLTYEAYLKPGVAERLREDPLWPATVRLMAEQGKLKMPNPGVPPKCVTHPDVSYRTRREAKDRAERNADGQRKKIFFLYEEFDNDTTEVVGTDITVSKIPAPIKFRRSGPPPKPAPAPPPCTPILALVLGKVDRLVNFASGDLPLIPTAPPAIRLPATGLAKPSSAAEKVASAPATNAKTDEVKSVRIIPEAFAGEDEEAERIMKAYGLGVGHDLGVSGRINGDTSSRLSNVRGLGTYIRSEWLDTPDLSTQSVDSAISSMWLVTPSASLQAQNTLVPPVAAQSTARVGTGTSLNPSPDKIRDIARGMLFEPQLKTNPALHNHTAEMSHPTGPPHIACIPVISNKVTGVYLDELKREEKRCGPEPAHYTAWM